MVEQRLYRVPEPVCVLNEEGGSPYLLICEHASNYVPEILAGLGLDEEGLRSHIAWDPGAAGVARNLSKALDATLVEAGISRLVIDCNRSLDAVDLVPVLSEATHIPGNANLEDEQRQQRIALSHQPFHERVEQVIAARKQRGQPSWIVTIHSFTPIYNGVVRPWHIGIIHDADDRLAAPLIAALKREASINVGVNEPYSPDDRVYYTLERHARNRGEYCVMIEIRNDEITDDAAQKQWAALLSECLSGINSTSSGRQAPNA